MPPPPSPSLPPPPPPAPATPTSGPTNWEIIWGDSCSTPSPGFCAAASLYNVHTCDTVTWRIESGYHNVVSGPRNAHDGHFQSDGLLSGEETFIVKFDQAGSYPYHCTPHENMNAVIVVHGEPCPNSPPTPPLLASPPSPPPPPPALPTVTLPPAQCTVIGAGPGGVLAADVMAGADGCGGSLRLFERGGLPLEGTYDTLPFFETFDQQETYVVGTYNGAGLPFAGVFGGQQTTNGGVFAPGTAAELAAGLAIGTAAAQAAQACAAASVNATYWKPLLGALPPPVPHVEGQTLLDHNGMLATCVGETGGCAWGDMILPPTFHTPGSAGSIRRRTVAHGVHGSGAPDYATLRAEVRSIDFEEDPDSGRSKIVRMTPAGANARKAAIAASHPLLEDFLDRFDQNQITELLPLLQDIRSHLDRLRENS